MYLEVSCKFIGGDHMCSVSGPLAMSSVSPVRASASRFKVDIEKERLEDASSIVSPGRW